MLPVQQATLEQFIQHLTDKKRSTATKDRYTYWLTKLAEQIPKPFNEMTAADLAEYLRTLDDLKPASRNTARHTFHHFFAKYMKNPGVLDHSEHPVLEKERIPIESPDILSDEQLQQLISATKTPRDKALLVVLVEGGMRVGALAEFPKGSPALKTGKGYMTFGDTQKVPHGYEIHVRHTKDREERRVPIYYYAADLKQWLTLHPTQKDDDPLWCYQQSGTLYPLKYSAMKRIVQQAAKRAGIKKKVHPHLLRKQWASTMKEKHDMDSWDIAQMGGWVPGSQQMRRYIRQNPKAVHDRYAKRLGIVDQPEEPIGPAVRKECLNCGEVLSPTSIYCPHCGQIQDKETVELHREAIKEARKTAAQYQERFERQDTEINFLKQQLAEQQKQIQEEMREEVRQILTDFGQSVQKFWQPEFERILQQEAEAKKYLEETKGMSLEEQNRYFYEKLSDPEVVMNQGIKRALVKQQIELLENPTPEFVQLADHEAQAFLKELQELQEPGKQGKKKKAEKTEVNP